MPSWCLFCTPFVARRVTWRNAASVPRLGMLSGTPLRVGLSLSHPYANTEERDALSMRIEDAVGILRSRDVLEGGADMPLVPPDANRLATSRRVCVVKSYTHTVPRKPDDAR